MEERTGGTEENNGQKGGVGDKREGRNEVGVRERHRLKTPRGGRERRVMERGGKASQWTPEPAEKCLRGPDDWGAWGHHPELVGALSIMDMC